MTNNVKHMFAVSFSPKTRQFSLDSTEAFIGKPIYDLDENFERNPEDNFEYGIHFAMQDILTSGLQHLNNILSTQQAQNELDLVQKIAYTSSTNN